MLFYFPNFHYIFTNKIVFIGTIYVWQHLASTCSSIVQVIVIRYLLLAVGLTSIAKILGVNYSIWCQQLLLVVFHVYTCMYEIDSSHVTGLE